MIKHVTDVKLNVKPVFIGFEHKYYYEGPCRMAGGEAIEPGYDGMVNGMIYKGFIEGLSENFGKIPFNMSRTLSRAKVGQTSRISRFGLVSSPDL